MIELAKKKLPEKWQLVALDRVADIEAGNPAPQGDKFFANGAYPFVRVQDMGKLDGAKYLSITKDSVNDLAAKSLKLFPAGTVLFTKSGASTLLNQRAILQKDAYVVSHIGTVAPLEMTTSDWLYYWLKTVDFANFAHGANMPSMPLSKVKSIDVPLPPLNEQKRIVAKIEELFSELDKGIESLKTAREQIKVYRQAVLKHAFEGKLTVGARSKRKPLTKKELISELNICRRKALEKEYQDAERSDLAGRNLKASKRQNSFKGLSEGHSLDVAGATDLPSLPDGWHWFQIKDLCDVVRGGSPRPAGDPKFYGGNIPFLKVADITGDDKIYLTTFTYTIKEAGLTKTRLIQPHKLLLSNSGATLGVPKICSIEATFNDGIAAFLGLDERTLLYYYYFWESKTEDLRLINQGAAQPNLNTDLIKEIFVPVCSLDEMQEVSAQIDKSLSAINALSNEIEENLIRAEMLRQAILKRAFLGQLVAQNLKDEPASILLERIRAEKEMPKSRTKKKRSAA